MNSLIRDFKRHYHKVKEVYSALAQTGNFGFQAKSDGTSITASCQTPDPVETVRFAVLMRRFLIPEDGLHYKKVWESLQEDNQHNLPAEMVEGINSLILNVEAGYGKITINGEEFSPRKIYETAPMLGIFRMMKERRSFCGIFHEFQWWGHCCFINSTNTCSAVFQ